MEALWQPSSKRIESSNLVAFCQHVNKTSQINCADYASLYQWSIEHPEDFWSAVWDYTSIVATTRGELVLQNGDKMPGATWFPESRLNYAENLLRYRDDELAIVFWGEDKVKASLTRNELYDAVSCLSQALRDSGVEKGDRVVGFMPNMPETVVAMLATTSIGAVWSSCSPDFGVRGVLDRFGQIEPKVLFTADGYFYNGKQFDSLSVVKDIAKELPTLERIIISPYINKDLKSQENLPLAKTLTEFVSSYKPCTIDFEQLPFNHPLFIMFSSGTTGVPKCIVHSAGGTLLQHLKEHQLHTDVKPHDRLFYFTTCGWMMWNWLVSGLASGATLMLYDGSPFSPDGNILFNYADEEAITHFGTSAKYIDAVNKAGLSPIDSHKLDSIRSILSTGSPLVPESFDFVYQHIKQDVCLSSISGGTDILSCFALGCSVLPVWRGELQSHGLGMKVEVYDDDGKAVRGEKGELVCTAPFPSMPIGFWNDPDNKKYQSAYFERYPGVWCHGDYVELTEHDGFIIHGRSDAVLNPGGVRIGTAEIYRQVETLEEVTEAIVIGQEWEGDVRVVLFVRLREDLVLEQSLIDKIKRQIRDNTTPRHVPAKVIQVNDIPRTKSGKIVELAVRNIVHNIDVKNREALANPEALELFKELPELAV